MMYYRPTKRACTRLGIPRGTVVGCEIRQDVYRGRSVRYAANIVMFDAAGALWVSRETGATLTGWKLAKRPRTTPASAEGA